MSEKQMAVVIDCMNQEIIERELTVDEINQKNSILNEYIENQEKIKNELLEKEAIRQSAIQKLYNLGLTEEEINSLIS